MKRPNEKGDLASEKRLMRDRSKKMIQDFKETYSMTTESRYANAHLDFKPDIAPKPMAGRQDALPKWHRWVNLSSGFLSSSTYILLTRSFLRPYFPQNQALNVNHSRLSLIPARV